jgi:hypothetical protein
MRKIIYAALGLLILLSPALHAQQKQGEPIKMKPNMKVNFKQLAAYEKLHPVSHKKEAEGEQDEDAKIFPPIFTADTVLANPTQNTLLTNSGQKNSLSQANSPSATLTFYGVPQDGWIPPDPDGAVGPNYVVEVTNDDVTIFNKTGAQVMQFGQNTLTNAIGCVTNGDMHVVYDPVNEHFLICMLLNSSPENANVGTPQPYTTVGIAYGVSVTNDPTGDWELNYFDANTTFIDFPGMGYDPTWFVITGNDITNGGAKMWVFDYSTVLNNSNTQGSTGYYFNLGSGYNTLGPAQTYDPTANTEYIVADGGDGTHMQLYTITGNSGSTPVFTTSTQLTSSSPWSETAVGVNALGSTTPIETGLDCRVYSAIYVNGQLWFTHNVYLPSSSPTYTGIDWWEYNPSTKSVTQYGRLSNSTLSAFYPSINVNANGDAMLTFCEASTSEYVGAYYDFHAGTDASGSLEGVVTLASGQGAYTQLDKQGRNRWGDYTGTAVDPTDGSFWGISEWAMNDTYWGTVIGRVPPSAGVCNGNIDLGHGTLSTFGTESSGTINSENTVPIYAYVTLTAATAVVLNPGFTANTGATFTAYPASCGESLAPALNSESDAVSGLSQLSGDETIRIIPNPFNSSFELSVTVNNDEPASVIIYNTLGAPVKELKQQQLTAGRNAINFDCSEFASGIYLVEIKAGDTRTVKKIVKN